jgi:hypothetical protein
MAKCKRRDRTRISLFSSCHGFNVLYFYFAFQDDGTRLFFTCKFYIPEISMPLLCRAAALIACLVLGGCPLAMAEEAIIAARGTAGLTPIPFTAENAGSQAIACAAATAHWYSVDLGTAVPGASVRTTLWASVGNGEVFVLNGKLDRMPIINLWCGLAGRSWATRSAVPLARAAGIMPKDILLSCHDAAGTLACR